MTDTEALEPEMRQAEAEWMGRSQAELFHALSLLSEGEANQFNEELRRQEWLRGVNNVNGQHCTHLRLDVYDQNGPAPLPVKSVGVPAV